MGLQTTIRDGISGILDRIASPKVAKALAERLIYGKAARKPHSVSVRDARSILVLRPDTIGDSVMMSPFLRELRRSNPKAWISLVVDPRVHNMVELCPYVNEAICFDPRYTGHLRLLGLHLRALRFGRSRLWPRHFDLALSPRWDTDYYHSAFVSYFSGATERIAYSEVMFPLRPHVGGGLDQLYTRLLDDQTPKHEIERNLDFLRAAGGDIADEAAELWLSDEDREKVQVALSSRGFRPDDTLVGFAPGAGHPKRMWPVERYIELGRLLIQRFGVRLLIVGGPEDRQRGLRFQEELGPAAVSFAGELTLRQTAALLHHTPLFISNDSGPMHTAAAAGAAVVEISCHPANGDPNHINSTVRFRPWARAYRVLQPAEPRPPCAGGCEDRHEAHCILGVCVADVFEATVELLDGKSEKSALTSLPAGEGTLHESTETERTLS